MSGFISMLQSKRQKNSFRLSTTRSSMRWSFVALLVVTSTFSLLVDLGRMGMTNFCKKIQGA